MRKLILNPLKPIIPNDDKTWDIFEKTDRINEPFFLLFKIFKPYDFLLNLPNTIKDYNKNIIFVKNKQLERDIVKIDRNDNVVEFLFKPSLNFYEPFALFCKDNDIDRDVERMLKRIIKNGNYGIEKVE